MELDEVNSANLLFELSYFFSVLICYRICPRNNYREDIVARDIVAKDIVVRDIEGH